MRISKAGISVTCALIATSVAVTTVAGQQAGAGPGSDVVISEIMIDPSDVYDSRGEWIELTNRGSGPVELGGWTLADDQSERVVLPDLKIGSGERIVLARYGDVWENGGADAAWVYGNGLVLFNGRDRLVLRDDKAVEHDRVEWSPESGLLAPTGRSLSLRDLALDGRLAASWCAATTVMTRGDLGSPGAVNVCDETATPLVITEILQNPKRTSDFLGEFFEVYNPTNGPVDMRGWTVKDDDLDRYTVDRSVVVPSGGYAVFGVSATDNGQLDVAHAWGDTMRLHNDIDELVIADTRGILVDRIAWDDGQSFPDPDGASMSLLDPMADNSKGANWCTATIPWAYGDFGSPGGPTWCAPPTGQPIVITEIMFDPEPPGSERAAEWFEIANLGAVPIDLSGWTITAGNMKTATISKLTVAPGAFAVLAASGDSAANGDIRPDYVYGTNPEVPFYNDSGRLILTARDGSTVDRVEWSAARGFPIPKGRSISLGFPSADNALGPNWCASLTRWAAGDFGTPGTLGSCGQPADAPALTITEILRNPAAVADSAGEWLEIHNPTGADVDVRGWSIGDADSDRHIVRSSVVVPAGGYAVIGRSTETSRNGGAPVQYSYGDSMTLGNGADEAILHDQYGRFVHEVRWDGGETWMRPNGASMAWTDLGWCVSGPQFGLGDRGTPGAANDCTPITNVAVVISEVHIDPGAVSDTVGEWIELANASPQPVDINGWVLRDDDADQHVIDAGGPLVIPAGGQIVLGREKSPSLNGGSPVDYSYGVDFPIVNGADEIDLLDAKLVPVDRVTWTTSRPLPAQSGASASLRSLTLDNGDPINWCRSITSYGNLGEYGTPGRPNECELKSPPPTTADTSTTTSTSTTSTTTSTTVPPTAPPTTAPASTSTTTASAPTTAPATAPVATSPTTAGYVLVALGTAVCSGDIDVAGGRIAASGSIRSNGDVKLAGSAHTVDGTISHAGQATLHKKITAPTVADPVPVTSEWTMTAQGLAPQATVIDGNWAVGSKPIAPGIYVVRGDVTISGSSPKLLGVTIAATGRVTINGAVTITPAAAGLPAVLAEGGSCSSDAISITGNSVVWSGALFAPNGAISVKGKSHQGGRLVGASIKTLGTADLRLG